jgi:hypothetical protein
MESVQTEKFVFNFHAYEVPVVKPSEYALYRLIELIDYHPFDILSVSAVCKKHSIRLLYHIFHLAHYMFVCSERGIVALNLNLI